MVPLDPLLLIEIITYKYSFTFHNTELVGLVEVHIESREWTACFRKEAMEVDALREVRKNSAPIMPPRQSF